MSIDFTAWRDHVSDPDVRRLHEPRAHRADQHAAAHQRQSFVAGRGRRVQKLPHRLSDLQAAPSAQDAAVHFLP